MKAEGERSTLNSADAQKAIAFLKEHHTVVDPTIALLEFFGGDNCETARKL